MSRIKVSSFISGIPLIILFLYLSFIDKLIFADRSGLIDEKIRQLRDYSAKSYVLKLNHAKFREYVKTPIKNYSFVVLFAAMASHRHCSMCSVVHDELELTAKSFRITNGGISDRLFFGFVDFDQNIEAFQSMNVNNVPLVMYFPSKRKMQKSDIYDMQKFGYSAESISKWLGEKTGIEFGVLRPSLFFGTAGLLVLFFVGSIVIYFRCENFGILNNRTLWSILAVAFCLLMTSGQIWNLIRCPPFLTKSPNGGLSYIYSSSNAQFIGETYIVFLLNAGITVTVIILIDMGYSSTCTRRYKVFPLIGMLAAALFFNILLSIFKIKISNYPYKGLL